MCSIAFRCSQRGPNVTSNDTRNSMMETKVPNFVSTMSRTIKCNHCTKLKCCLYCIYRCFNTQNYIYPFQNLSLGVILKIFLKFREFQPRYSYKKRVYMYKGKGTGNECWLTFSDGAKHPRQSDIKIHPRAWLDLEGFWLNCLQIWQ